MVPEARCGEVEAERYGEWTVIELGEDDQSLHAVLVDRTLGGEVADELVVELFVARFHDVPPQAGSRVG